MPGKVSNETPRSNIEVVNIHRLFPSAAAKAMPPLQVWRPYCGRFPRQLSTETFERHTQTLNCVRSCHL